MKYKNIDLLDCRIENIIKRTVKYYYTDWKNYDRIKYIHCKASNQKEDKKLILIVRTCGTYLIKESELQDKNSWSFTLWNYFHNQESANFYFIDLDKLTVIKERGMAA